MNRNEVQEIEQKVERDFIFIWILFREKVDMNFTLMEKSSKTQTY